MNSKLSVILTLFFSFAVCVTPASLRAAEQTGEYRIVGLFSPDRVGDLQKVMADIPEFQLVHVDYETARVTVRYDLKTLFPTLDPKKPPTNAQIEQSLNHLLGEASNQTFVLKPLSKTPREKLTKVEIVIGILDCKGCRYGAYLMAMKEDGVEQATVVDKLVTAWIDSSKTSQTAIEEALKKGRVEKVGKR